MLNQISIIRVVLDENFDIMPYLHWFNLADQKKIASYYHYKDRLISFTSHLLQKFYLPYVTNCRRDSLVIDYTTHLKPYISSPKDIAGNFSFNISHCHNQVVLAMYRGSDYAIGVDIEHIDSKVAIDEMAPIVFSEPERKLINNLATNFFKLWTKKESLIKALGTGFATDFYQDTVLNLDDFEAAQNYQIATQKIDDYYLSICLLKQWCY
jgi:phosphopantetheinyl transferase